MTGLFVVVGVLGTLLVVTSLLLDDVIDDVIPGLPFLSGPVIGAFLVAFGAFGWFAVAGPGMGVLAAIALAVGGGALLAGFTYRLTAALANSPTDGTPTTESLIGRPGKVVTPVRSGGVGEVLVTLGGAPTKYTATAATDLPTGTAIVVIAVESPTKVRVEPETEFWR